MDLTDGVVHNLLELRGLQLYEWLDLTPQQVCVNKPWSTDSTIAPRLDHGKHITYGYMASHILCDVIGVLLAGQATHKPQRTSTEQSVGYGEYS